jgi:hypothetical protein
MARYAVVDRRTNVVANVAEWDGTSAWRPPLGHDAVRSDVAKINDRYNPVTGAFTPPPPAPITRTEYLITHDCLRANLEHALLTNNAAELTRLRTEYAAANALEPGVIGLPY